MNSDLFSSYLEVDLAVLRGNIEKILTHLAGRCAMMPTVKGDAYGLGMERVAALLTEEYGVRTLTVAQVYEGLCLREAGFACDILVMGAAPVPAIAAAVAGGLQLTVFQADMARHMNEAARTLGIRATVHIKLDTGMSRLGLRPGAELEAFLEMLRGLKHLDVAGVFTHFATSFNRGDPFTLQQFAAFQAGVAQVREAGLDPRYVHCCNSGAIVWLDAALACTTHVRPGSLYLGYDMMADGSNPLGVEEAASWRARLTHIRTVYPGEAVGYGRFFRPAEPTEVGTVSIGYADGLFRPMTQMCGPVLVNDSSSRYLGCCMDQCFVDVTGLNARVGDAVTIIGRSHGGALLSALELERLTGQAYQIFLCGINSRVVRMYLG